MIKTKSSNPKKKRSNGFSSWIEEKFVPVLGKMGEQRHLGSIRDAFATITPLIIAGALSVLIITSFFGGWDASKTSLLGQIANWSGGVHKVTYLETLKNSELFLGQWQLLGGWEKASTILGKPFELIAGATLDLIGLWFTFMLGYFLSKTRGFDNAITAGLVSLGSFMIVTQADKNLFGSAGSLIGIAVGIAATELYVALTKIKKLEIKMPKGVPIAVGRSFSKLIPIILTLVIIGTIDTVVFWMPAWLNDWGYTSTVGTFGTDGIQYGGEDPSSGIHFGSILYYAVISPFLSFASSGGGGLGIGLLYVFLTTFIWFFGLHGDNVLDGIFGTIFLTLIVQNTSHISEINAGKGAFVPAIVNNSTLYSFVIMGGTGASLSLLIAILVFSKTANKDVAKFALPASVFQVNEPVIFGLPIVLNGVFFIPFVFVQPVLLLSAWLVIKFGWVTTPYLQIPWTAPPVIGGLISTGFDWKSIILSVFNLALAFGIYSPFVLLNNKIEKKEAEQRLAEEAQNNKKTLVKEGKKNE